MAVTIRQQIDRLQRRTQQIQTDLAHLDGAVKSLGQALNQLLAAGQARDIEIQAIDNRTQANAAELYQIRQASNGSGPDGPF